MNGTLYLIPVTLGEESQAADVLPLSTLSVLREIREFIVENEKSARAFLKRAGTKIAMPDLILHPIGKHVSPMEMNFYLNAAKKGGTIGLLSEAGCPGVADPGAQIVSMAHKDGIKVVPLVGPSSLLLALMASGMNGQDFHFHGYIPIDKTARFDFLKHIERETKKYGTTHFFIETPFRNNHMMEDLLKALDNGTKLCVACDINLPTEFIRTSSVGDWKINRAPDLHKRPAVFLIGK
ncbi:MAG TPA: SAM-dependent methyltransferase [Bacteroidia bacterium]|nr:SAM-dependent methyltransferase [Bacteroidia bacterium]